MRPKGSAEALEMRRKNAAKLFDHGFGVRKVARLLGVSPGSASRWNRAYEADGEAGLAAKPPAGHGRPPKLDYDEYPRLERLLLEGPTAHGFATDLWTLGRIATVIDREFDVTYSESGVRKVLRRLGWSYQQPQSYSRKRDDDAVAGWRSTTWPQLKNGLAETVD